MFEPTWIWPNFTFGQLLMWIGANNDQIWLPMGKMSDSEQFSNRFELDLISLLVNFSCNWANNNHIWLPMGKMSDSEQCSNRLELYLISLLVNFSCGLGQIITRYDFLWARCVILSNVWTDLKLTLFQCWVNFSCELGQIMTIILYEFLWARWVILSNVRTDLNFT